MLEGDLGCISRVGCSQEYSGAEDTWGPRTAIYRLWFYPLTFSLPPRLLMLPHIKTKSNDTDGCEQQTEHQLMQLLVWPSESSLPVFLYSFKAAPMQKTTSMIRGKGLQTHIWGAAWESQAASGLWQLGSPIRFCFFSLTGFAYFNTRCHPPNFLVHDETFQLNTQLPSS